jgi:hypothetical protein
MGWHGLARSRIRYPLLANAVQRLLTAMVGQDREEANRLQQAKWELTSFGMKVTFRTHSISPGDRRSSRGSGPATDDPGECEHYARLRDASITLAKRCEPFNFPDVTDTE